MMIVDHDGCWSPPAREGVCLWIHRPLLIGDWVWWRIRDIPGLRGLQRSKARWTPRQQRVVWLQVVPRIVWLHSVIIIDDAIATRLWSRLASPVRIGGQITTSWPSVRRPRERRPARYLLARPGSSERKLGPRWQLVPYWRLCGRRGHVETSEKGGR